MGGRLVNVAVVITEGVISRPRDHAVEQVRERLLVRRAGFISPDSLSCHKVRVGTLPASHPVLIMHIDHDLVLGAPGDGLVHPARPPLVTMLDEAELQPGDPPLLVDRKQRVEIAFEVAPVDVEDDPDVVFLRVLDDGREVEVAPRDGAGIGLLVPLVAIPAGVILDELQSVLDREVDTGQPPLGGEGNVADHLSRPDPARIGNLARLVQVQQEIVIVQQLTRPVRRHDHAPRGLQGK